MKTKNKPTKRKLPVDVSVECDEGAMPKKQCLDSSEKFCVNSTVDTAIAALKPSVIGNKLACSVTHGSQVSANESTIKLQPKPSTHEESDIVKQSRKCWKQSTPASSIGNSSSMSIANVNYSNAYPIDQEDSSSNTNIKCTPTRKNIGLNIATNGNDPTAGIHIDNDDPYAVGIPSARSIKQRRFRKRKSLDSTVRYQTRRVKQQLTSEKVLYVPTPTSSHQHTNSRNVTNQVTLDDNYCNKQLPMEDKPQNFLPDESLSLCGKRQTKETTIDDDYRKKQQPMKKNEQDLLTDEGLSLSSKHQIKGKQYITVANNCCKKQRLTKEKQQDFLTNEVSSDCSKHQTKGKQRIRRWRKIYADSIGTHYLNQDSISTLNSIPLEYIHLGQCTCVCRYCGAMFWECEKVDSASYGKASAYNKCCYRGRTVLRPPPEYPQYIKELYNDAHFMDNIRAYNQMFSMTSLGANIDNSVNTGKGPYVFRVSGQIYHWIGSMCPDEGKPPRFLQLYICDTTNEVNNRLAHFHNNHDSKLKKEIVEGLIEFLDDHNALVQLFRTARDKYMEADIPEFKVRLYNVLGTRQYELPTAETVGAIVFAQASDTENEFDLIVEEHSHFPQRVNKLHPCYMSLQFPLLFIYGEDGYHKDMKLANVLGQSTKADKRLSMNMYYSYQMHDRLNHYSLLLRGGKLFQQYIVTAYCAIEQNRLDYIRQKQSDIRNEYLSGIYDAIFRGDRDGSDLGLRTVLTASFTGGPRYIYAHYLDALAICRVHGSPSFFITFTCNAKWPEIEEFMEQFPQLTTADRADIVDRVFEKKVRDYVNFVRNSNTFGDVTAVLYTIEFQKRGLPHCHSLLWVSGPSKVQQDIDVDKYVSAELPDPIVDIAGYSVVSELMIHGPCGAVNMNASCMKDGRTCNRHFPKAYCDKTYIDKDGFVHYRRRDDGIETQRQNVWLDNRYVVPYNRTLCMRYYAHINVEYCGWTMLIKYLFKYISKGTDRVVANVTKPVAAVASTSNTPSIHVDEIKNYVEARYIGPHEACWRILDFPIHYRNPPVQTLAVHLENMQQITFRSKDNLESVVNNPVKKKTTLTEWLEYNKYNTDGRHLTYLNFPSEYTWHVSDKYWQRRRYLNKFCIGRLTYVHPAAGDLFYERMLLCHQKGCRSFAEIRTLNGITYPTNKASCQALGLLGGDEEWIGAFQEAAAGIHIDNGDPYAIGIPSARSIEHRRFRKRESIDSTVRYQTRRVKQQLTSEKVSYVSTPTSNHQHTNLRNATKLTFHDNCCKKQPPMEEKPQNFLTDEGPSLCLKRQTKEITVANNCCKKQWSTKEKQQNFLTNEGSSQCPKHQTKGKNRIRRWRKIYADPIGTHYLNEDSISTSNSIPLEYTHLGQCTCVCRYCGAMFWECEKVVCIICQMTEANKTLSHPADKGKLPLVEANPISLAQLNPTDVNKTIEARGNAIQANMNLSDTDYFDQQLQLNNAYRISRFMCTKTKLWDRTLPNNTTLLFGKYTSIIPISNAGFPDHHFNFIAYNEVDERANVTGAPLTNYIGCIYRISNPLITGEATRTRRTRRIIDIQNLEKFCMNEYATLQKPVIIAALQLSATSATHYYLNPNIPEANYILSVYADLIDPTPALEI
ncbi:DNA helicase [Tanacetum coccineum]|uniref:DNA helicase n=1 Tax=Tanacetum coccineum TaxID=301880 RepID=A0ABQ4XZ52_9ASTR